MNERIEGMATSGYFHMVLNIAEGNAMREYDSPVWVPPHNSGWKERPNAQGLRPNSHGFTMVEVLVVIAIIAILMALLFPSLQKATQTAKSVLCLNNLKQDCSAAFLYAGDYHNFVHLQGQATDFERDGVKRYYDWSRPLVKFGYLPATDLRGCPTGVKPYAWNEGYGVSWKSAPDYPLINTTINKNWYVMRRITAIRSPSKYQYIIDSAKTWGTSGQSYEVPWTPTSGIGMGLRHLQQANSAYWDGHAKGGYGASYRTTVCTSAYLVEDRQWPVVVVSF